MLEGRKRRGQALTPSGRDRPYKADRRTGSKRWQAQAMGRTFLMEILNLQRWRSSAYVLAAALLAVMLTSSGAAAGEGASWKVGRGVISGSGAGSGLSLKISLRNAGAPSTGAVRVLGRWTGSRPGRKKISRRELSGFRELGLFTREVEMKKTAILEMTLAPLGPRPAGRRAVEVAVITGSGITDGVVIAIDF